VPGSTPHKKHFWLDVGDLLCWKHNQVTGIQRVMASVAAEFLKLQASGVPVRFCRCQEEIGFFEVPQETVRRCLHRLIGEKASLRLEETSHDLKDVRRQPGPKAPLRHGSLDRARRALRGVLRLIYGPLSRAAEPRPHELPTAITPRLRRMVRRLEVWCLRKGLRADKIFRPNDLLLNIGSGWSQPTYPATLAAIRRNIDLRYVALIHDLIPFRLPQCFSGAMVSQFVDWAQATISAADQLLTISDSSSRDVLAFAKAFDIPEKPITVILLGQERAAELDATLPAEFAAMSAGFVLCVGTVEARKNHILLVRTWSRLLQRHDRSIVPHLVWVGRKGWMIDALLDELAKVHFLDGKLLWLGQEGGLPESTLHALYRACLFTMFPSTYEGWGLPVSESLAHGKLCIASNASSIPEVGGDLADYHGPEDLDKCLELVERAIFDPDYRAAKEVRIRRESRMPSWAACSQSILEACRTTSESGTM
jgi:glycosyltransferase involved in cell wall biosynthesis